MDESSWGSRHSLQRKTKEDVGESDQDGCDKKGVSKDLRRDRLAWNSISKSRPALAVI